jgi:hypothetical protein
MFKNIAIMILVGFILAQYYANDKLIEVIDKQNYTNMYCNDVINYLL